MANTKLVERGNRVAKIVVLRTTVTIVKNAAEIRVFPITWGRQGTKIKTVGILE